MKALAALAALAAVLLPGAAGSAKPPFSRAVVIVFENTEVGRIVGNPDAPTFNSLARRGAFLSQYTAVAHPSLPNYLALVSGSTHGITNDCTECLVAGRSLADTLTAGHRTWKTYAEGLPHAGWTGGGSGAYAKKHDPFLYFRSVVGTPSQRQRVVRLARLRADLAAQRLPDFSLVVPNLCHDMHDCSIADGDAWLRHWLEPLLASKALAHGVVFVLFDEGSGASYVGGGGHVAAYAVGPAVRPGTTIRRPVSHYNVLATLEAAWGLPRLGKSANAAPLAGIWRGGN
jgi:hypothetical protein